MRIHTYHIVDLSSQHGHLLNLLATPVTLFQGWQSGSDIHTLTIGNEFVRILCPIVNVHFLFLALYLLLTGHFYGYDLYLDWRLNIISNGSKRVYEMAWALSMTVPNVRKCIAVFCAMVQRKFTKMVTEKCTQESSLLSLSDSRNRGQILPVYK